MVDFPPLAFSLKPPNRPAPITPLPIAIEPLVDPVPLAIPTEFLPVALPPIATALV